jgi:hypothetical protein
MASNVIAHNPFFFIFSYYSFLVFTQAWQKYIIGKSGHPYSIGC